MEAASGVVGAIMVAIMSRLGGEWGEDLVGESQQRVDLPASTM